MKFTAWVPSLLRPHFHQNQACTSSNLTSLALNEKCCESKINFKAQMSAKENGKSKEPKKNDDVNQALMEKLKRMKELLK